MGLLIIHVSLLYLFSFISCCFSTLHQNLLSYWNYDAPIEYEHEYFYHVLGPACEQNDLDSNECGYTNTCLRQSFQSVQLQLEVYAQNSSNNGMAFIPCVSLILDQILKIKSFNVVI